MQLWSSSCFRGLYHYGIEHAKKILKATADFYEYKRNCSRAFKILELVLKLHLRLIIHRNLTFHSYDMRHSCRQ